MPQDIVLDRVINYRVCNPQYENTPFWIDKLCITQDDQFEKKLAINSMDLVYHYGHRSVGLLFTRIDSLDQLKNLRYLLDGLYAESRAPALRAEQEDSVLELIETIIQDDWWRRAWIFQEEFLASANMVLLIPCSVDRGDCFRNEKNEDPFGKTSGEIEVFPLNFRTCVTEFCLKLMERADAIRHARCSDILKVARRYSWLHRVAGQEDSSPPVKAMSPAIIEDLTSRGITIPSDVLAITANCCRYTTRLDSQILDAANESLSIALLTLFVQNGEIICHNASPEDVLQGLSLTACTPRN